MELARHLEGRTKLVVPKVSLTAVPPPTAPVFFNPAASLNRDVTVAVAAASGGGTFCDAMAGTGARGVRVANETEGVEAVMVDFNGEALALAKKSAALNGVARKCSFAVSETSSYLFSRFGRDQRFDLVDLDPFGTPIRQLQGALSATADGGIISVTATDTAVLCGVHRSTCSRRYGAAPLNNSFHHETGIRILFASMVRIGASVDIGVEPVAAHSTRHYIRVFARVNQGASRAESALRGIGYISWCPGCGDLGVSGAAGQNCPLCSKRLRRAGPLWVSRVVEESLIKEARREADARGLADAAGMLGSLSGANDFPPWSFDIDQICSELKVPTVPELPVYRALTSAGHRVMRTPFERTGLKTRATRTEVVRAVKAASGGRKARTAAKLR